MKPFRSTLALLLAIDAMLAGSVAHAESTQEYRAKVGFLYNFIAFTEWPERVGSPLPLCVYGESPIGDELGALEGKMVNGRSLTIRYPESLEQVKGCRVLFVAGSAIGALPRILEVLQGEPVLTVADARGALDSGAGINMLIRQNKIVFEVNLAATRNAQLTLSSKLLRLAREVRQ